MEIRQVTAQDLDLLVPLFDAYRMFYGQPSEPDRVRRFLEERIQLSQSVIFLALHDGTAAGFTQLYPSFTSLGLGPIFILNDLFVAPETRRLGAGVALLQAAANYGRSMGAIRLKLSTQLTNTTAQSLYERADWKRETLFCTYELKL